MRRLILLCTLFSTLAHAELPETDWLELMPEEDRRALEEMPEIEHQGAELESGFYSQGGLKQQADLPAVMYSSKTVASLDRRSLRLGGYPVPLETDARGRSTQFFLVPYPGACIHVPPPPPNQIILVNYPEGIRLDDIYAPIWVSGPLHIEQVSNELAEVAYTMRAEAVRLVEDSDL